MADADIEASFPNLRKSVWKQTSDRTPKYNCIAWAAGDDRRWWWPMRPGAYWPAQIPKTATISSFTALFESLGFGHSLSSSAETGAVKIALYAIGDEVKHAARQLPSGNWTSKLGNDIDIEHELVGLEDSSYGKVVAFFRRQAESAAT